MAEIIPFDRRDGGLWFDGKLVPWEEAKIHALNHGLHYASSVFEGERLYNGRVYKLEEHTARLFQSARILGMRIPFTQEEINAATMEAVAAQGFTDAYIRPVVWRGSEQMSVAAPNSTIHVAIAVWQWPYYFDPTEKLKGIRLEISRWRRPAPDCAPTKSKAAGLYMICTISKHEAESRGYGDAMMLDYRGYVAEATGANIFFVQGRRAAHADRGLLPERHHAPVGDRARARASDSGDRALHRAGGSCRTSPNASSPAPPAEVTPVAEIGAAHVQARPDV